MENIPDFVIVWLIYLAAVLAGLFVFWRMTRPIPWLWCKEILRALVATLLLWPAVVIEGDSFLAPAFIVTGFDFLAGGPAAALRAGQPLLIAVICVPGLVLLYRIVRSLMAR